MFHDWLHRPHVAEWWGEPPKRSELEQSYFGQKFVASTARAYIATLSSEPIGFIQRYVPLGSGGGWWEQETDAGVRGIDQFLANGGALGRGVGSSMICAFVDQLFQDPAITKVQADPPPCNERAIRSYQKAGFVIHSEVVTPDGPALLMLRYRQGDAIVR